MWCYVNGSFVSTEEAKLSVQDLGIARGYGVFDYLRTYSGRPFHLKEHLLRLKYSADSIGLSLPNSLNEISEIIDLLLAKCQLQEAALKITATGGMSTDPIFCDQKPSLIISASPLNLLPDSYYANGINVITTSLSRSLPMSKTTYYAPAIMALKKGRQQNAQEALYLNSKNEILEATTSNFFAFKKGVLHTCSSDEILIGITSEIVLQLAKEIFPVKKEAVHLYDLPLIEEAFITASNKEILPVVSIDGEKIGAGKVGPKTKHVQELFRNYTRQLQWPELQIPRYQDL